MLTTDDDGNVQIAGQAVPAVLIHDLFADLMAGRSVLVTPSEARGSALVVHRNGTAPDGRPLMSKRLVKEQHVGILARQIREQWGSQ